MGNEFVQARQQALDVKSLLRDGHLGQAVRSATLAAQAALSPGLSKGELADLRRILEKVVYILNFDPVFRQVCPGGLDYASGDEKRLVQALTPLEGAIEITRNSMEAEERAAQASRLQDILDRAKAYLAEDEAKKAVVFLRKNAKEHAANFDFVMKLGQLLYQAKLFSEAYDIYELAQKTRPNDIVLLNLMGSCLRQIGKHDFAARIFAQALDLDKENPALLFNAARNFIDVHKWVQAQELLKKALVLDPNFEPATKALRAVERHIFGR